MDTIHFYSYQEGLDNIHFESNLDIYDDMWIFDDKTYEDTKIRVLFKGNGIEFIREGKVNNQMLFKLNEYTKASYSSDIGLVFDYEILTKEIMIKDNKIKIVYDYFMDKEKISSVKIILIMKSNLLKN